MWEMWCDLSWSDLAVWFIAACFSAVVAEATSEIVTDSALLGGFRNAIGKKAVPDDPKDAHWSWSLLYKLITCGYCCSVWTSLLVSLIVPGHWFGLLPWHNLLFKTLFIHRLSNLYHTAFDLMRRGRVRTYDLKVSIGDEIQITEVEANHGSPRSGIGEAGPPLGN